MRSFSQLAGVVQMVIACNDRGNLGRHFDDAHYATVLSHTILYSINEASPSGSMGVTTPAATQSSVTGPTLRFLPPNDDFPAASRTTTAATKYHADAMAMSATDSIKQAESLDCHRPTRRGG